MDVLGQYGLMIQCNDNFIQPKRNQVERDSDKIDNTSTPNHLILLLKDLTDWELF